MASVAVYMVGSIPYYIDIVRGRTKPERAAWWIWTLLGIIAFAAQVASGATWSALVTLIGTLDVFAIAVLSLKHGYGSFGARDVVGVTIATLAVALWAVTDKPIIALLLTISADLVGYALVSMKAWQSPYSETLVAWVASTVASVLGVLAAGHASFEVLLYPVYLVIGEGAMTSIIILRRRMRPAPVRVRIVQ